MRGTQLMASWRVGNRCAACRHAKRCEREVMRVVE